MTIELFGLPRSRANRVQWMLEELGLPYEYHKIELFKGEHKQAPHLERHPHGLVPAMTDGDLRMIESSAMVLHLADKTGKLAPPVGSNERARLYQFAIYAAATLDHPVVDYVLNTMLYPPDRRDASKAEAAKPHIATGVNFIERELGDADYLLGNEFSAADVCVGYTINLIAACGLLGGGERITAYHNRLAARPAFKRVFG
jgi:glutathione S-transferase